MKIALTQDQFALVDGAAEQTSEKRIDRFDHFAFLAVGEKIVDLKASARFAESLALRIP